MRTHMALSQFETGDYSAARRLLLQTVTDGAGRITTKARIRLARTDLRLGDLAAADEALSRAQEDLDTSPNNALRSLMSLVQGERALELNIQRLRATTSHARHRSGRKTAAAGGHRSPRLSGAARRAERSCRRGTRPCGRQPEGGPKLAHHSLEARCRVLLAQLEFARNRFDEAAAHLNGIPPDASGQTNGAELRAEVHLVEAGFRRAAATAVLAAMLTLRPRGPASTRSAEAA